MARVSNFPAAPTSSVPNRHARQFAGLNGLDWALILTMTVWSGNVVISKAATDVLAPLAYNALRFTVAPITMFLLLRWRRVDFHLPRPVWLPVLIAALFNFTLYQAAFINGLHLTTAGNNALIMAAGPVWVALITAVSSQERVTRGALLGVFVALFGVGVVVIGRGGAVGFDADTIRGDLLTLLASVFWALGVLASRRAMQRDPSVPTMTIVFWVMLFGSVSQMGIGLPSVLQMNFAALTPGVFAALIYSGAASVAVGTLIFQTGIARRGAAHTAVFSNLQPLITGGLAILFLGESMSLGLLIGGVLILLGVALVRRT